MMEKNIIRDMMSFPYDYTLYCLRDSFLDQKARETNISRIHYKGRKVERLTDFTNYFELKRLIAGHGFNIIYCCHFKSLWVLCTLLRNDNKTALAFYNTRIFHQYFTSPWFRLLSRRIDCFFVCSMAHQNNLQHYFAVPPRKIINLGMGLLFDRKRKKIPNNPFQLSILVGSHQNEIQKYDILFHAFPPLISLAKSRGIGLRLNFVTEHSWTDHFLYQKLQEKTVLFGFDQNINFIDRISLDGEETDESHLWIDLGEDESVSPVLVEALGRGIPTLLARRPFIQGRIRDHQGHGETFKQHDPRDLRDKCLKILENYFYYDQGAQRVSQDIVSDHSRGPYERQLQDGLQRISHRKGQHI